MKSVKFERSLFFKRANKLDVFWGFNLCIRNAKDGDCSKTEKISHGIQKYELILIVPPPIFKLTGFLQTPTR